VVAALFGTLKLMQMYGRRHRASAKALEGLLEAVREAAGGEAETSIGVRGQRIQVNDRPIRSAECGALAAAFFAEEFARRRISRIRMAADVTPADLDAFASAFLELDLNLPDPAERLIAACFSAGVRGVTVEAATHDETTAALMERRESAMRVYLSGLRAFQDVLRADGLSDSRKVRRARRSVQDLVERFLEDESTVLALAQIHAFDEKLFNHSLNVCLFALSIGQRIGLSRRQLGELGLAALFHDIGKTAVSLPSGPSDPPEREIEQARRHPARGARMLLATGSAQEGLLKAAIAAYEHHCQYDCGGYPPIDRVPHLLARIVAIADCFEALTSARAGRRALAPHEAFALMRGKAGTLFDPLLLKVFLNALGVYPTGTLVELSSGEVALVSGTPGDTAPDRPRVRVMRTARGALAPETLVDLAETGPDGAFVRSIARSVAAHEVFASVAEFVAAI
jgi:HD-GYP domain-containing protein (c-di-GMP phosphodiesterase class II)